MKEKLQAIREKAIEMIMASDNLDKLNEIRVAYLGKKGELTEVLKGMKDVAAEDRPKVGAMVNETRAAIEEKLEEIKTKLASAARDAKLKKEVIDTYGFKTKTLTEDIEFAGLCALNNIKIDFVEEAITYDEQPTNFKVSWVQRKRWSRGCLECYKNYAFDLIKNMSKNKSCLDLLMLYFAPMVHIFTIVILLLSLTINLTTGDYTSVISKQSIINSIIGSSIIYLAQVIICISVVILNKKKLKKYISGILLFPVFMITWLPINIVILFQKNVKWQHIPHSKDITIDEI